MTWPGMNPESLFSVSGPRFCCSKLAPGIEADSVEGNELCDAVLRYINQALMEDDSEGKERMIQDSTLHAVEKSFYEILNEKSPPSPDQHMSHEETRSRSDDSAIGISASNLGESGAVNYFHESFHVQNTYVDDEMEDYLASGPLESQSSWWLDGWVDESKTNLPSGVGELFYSPNKLLTALKPTEEHLAVEPKAKKKDGNLPGGLQRGKKSLQREESDMERRSNKHFASDPDESLLNELFDNVLNTLSSPNELKGAEGSNTEILCTKRWTTKRESLDMRNLLLQCMQAVADNNKASATLLKQIRQQSSPFGDGSQRLAHYFANGLEARLLGARSPEYKAVSERCTSDVEIMKAYKMFLMALPFMETAYFFTTQLIMELAEKAASIHVIHFGIIHGIQWPYLIQCLSTRPGGPPKLRITGIDGPQSGFRPDSRVKETGRRLARYCEKFHVPFQFNGIAQKWETLSINDLRIEKDEVMVVNCMGQSMHLLDDTIMEHSPRDTVLNLIRRINPDLFVHSISNGSYNSPFFISRFREALFHYSSLFDMLDANVPRGDHGRMAFEREMWGKEIVNILASEGVERIERPETYKKWTTRMVRAGLRQLPLNKGILERVRANVKSSYHKDFFVAESSKWLLEGWRGRVIFAFSCWKAS